MDEVVPDELKGIGPPWCLTDGLARMEAARALETTPGTIAQALDVLDRCRRWAAAHPHPLSMYDQVVLSRALAPMEDSWGRWRNRFEKLMPTLDDVRRAGVAALTEEGARAEPESEPGPSPEMIAEFVRVWMDELPPILAGQVSNWLRERLTSAGTRADRRRYFSLLAASVPNLGEYGNGMVTHLEMAGGLDAAAYLLGIQRDPRTGHTARRLAGEYLELMERHAYPGGEDLPEEIWRRRGKCLAGVWRGFVRQYGGPAEDQLLELLFLDGDTMQIWAGYEGRLRFEDGRSGEPYEECRLVDDDGEEGHLLAEGVIWYLRDERERAAAAVGRTLSDFRLSGGDGDQGLELRFETGSVTLQMIADLQFTITWTG
ncbi:hypothetical protein [Nonomuraea rubra]|uniref:Uncharacterized protein n=1 Tax=Nonomuraea rubra TaxID=46180 RepID=A0A7X0NU30_9ACTN|nr:hypothetical protein [Nonomuraea rubra]MBB6549484.1 hypothetical protein [Nonomuraea rubra]